MEYDPPGPLATLITPTILSKYHRIFAFNLRLMRGVSQVFLFWMILLIPNTVENVVHALFRMTRRTSSPLFPTFTASQKLFFHFRFVSQAFVTSLSSYVYDTAIRRNFDAFFAAMALSGSTTRASLFSDVFSIAEYHSLVMDDILSACLLRSGQKDVGDLLRGALEIILEFGLLMSDIITGKLKEYQAVHDLERILKTFRTKVITLVRLLSYIPLFGFANASRPKGEGTYGFGR